MTGQQTRFEHHSRSASRRPGIISGRRFALVLAVAGVLLAGWGGVAAGDDSVVSATVYGGSSGRATNSSVSLTTLNGCTTSKTDPINLYPGPSSFQPTPASWTLATVVTCGLGIPKSNIASVQVYDTSGAPESPLTSAQLSDPSQWPLAGGALPLISTEAAEDLNTYVRPWQGSGDNNAADQVIATGPIAIAVTETGSVLNVNAGSQQQSPTTFAFSATVTRPDGTAAPAADLSYSWNFGDGSAPSTSPTPTHTFQQSGAYPVMVQVADAADGMDGNGHTNVDVASSPTPGSNPHPGGTSGTHGKNPTGPSHTKGTKSGAKAGKSSSSSGKGGPGTQATNLSGTSGTSGGTASAPPSSPIGKTTSSRTAKAHHHAAPTKGRRTPVSGPAAVVSGRLISDIALLPAAASPLVHSVATAPPVRRAVSASTSPWAALAAGLGVLLIFGLGARRELRWRRAWRLAHLPG